MAEVETDEQQAEDGPRGENPWAGDDVTAIAAIVEERLQEQRSRRGWRRFGRR